MWWWDGAGAWTITVYITDNDQNSVINNSATFSVGLTTGFVISPSTLTWASLSAGSVNQTSNNDPILINNTGNKNITLGNIQINATDLRGETDSNLALWAGNFSISPFTGTLAECNSSATTMNDSIFTNISSAWLPAGNYTKNDNVTGQETLFFCLQLTGTELSSQPYSTANETSWTIQI